MSSFADGMGTPAAAAAAAEREDRGAHGDQAPAPAPGGMQRPPSETHFEGGVGGDLDVFPLGTAAGAGSAGAGGKKQMANILCCLCGRSIQPNGEMNKLPPLPPPRRTIAELLVCTCARFVATETPYLRSTRCVIGAVVCIIEFVLRRYGGGVARGKKSRCLCR